MDTKVNSKSYLLDTMSITGLVSFNFLNGVSFAMAVLAEPVSWGEVAWCGFVGVLTLIPVLVALEAWRFAVRWRTQVLERYRDEIMPAAQAQYERIFKLAEDAGLIKRLDETVH